METDTIAAIATPPGTGAVAIVRISGPRSAEVASAVFRGPALRPRRQTHGLLVGPGGAAIDDVLATLFRGPASYTGEDSAEIACHGGMLVTRRVLDAVLTAGARPAEPGEFTQRAFLNGKLDLTQAEAVMDLISARTDLAMRAARGQLDGRLGGRLEALRGDLLGALAHIEAYIDFPDEDIDPATGGELAAKLRSAAAAARSLAATEEGGRILREGLATVLAGPPNAGKSSLLNVLLGFERAIVSDTPGTTRDTIEETVNLRGIPVRLTDTAGIRQAGDEIERQGIARTGRALADADLVIEVADGSRPRDEHPALDPAPPRHLLAVNKADLGLHPSWGGEGLPISCRDGSGIDALLDAIAGAAAGGGAWGDDLVTVNARHRAWLDRAAAAAERAAGGLGAGLSPEFVAVDAREALEALGEIVGRTDAEDILGEIFGSFCIGK